MITILVVAEMNEVLEIQISHVSTKNEQTIGLLERTERMPLSKRH